MIWADHSWPQMKYDKEIVAKKISIRKQSTLEIVGPDHENMQSEFWFEITKNEKDAKTWVYWSLALILGETILLVLEVYPKSVINHVNYKWVLLIP